MKSMSYSLSNIDETILGNKYLTETTIYFVIQGLLTVELNNQHYEISEGNFLVGNLNDRIEISTHNLSEVTGFILTIDNLFFTSVYPQFLSTRFVCYSEGVEIGKQESYLEIRKHLCELILTHYSTKPIKELIISMSLNQIILWLVQYFKQANSSEQQIQHELILEVLDYLDDHYFYMITLEDVSKEFYVTTSGLSKLFKDVTGTHFSTYLNELRVSSSLNDLIFSGLSMDEIALRNGFGSSKTYREHFKKIHGESPGSYRKKRKTAIEKQEKEESVAQSDSLNRYDVLNSLYTYTCLPSDKVTKVTNVVQHRKVNILNQTPSNMSHPKIIIQVGSLNELLDYGTFKELERIQKDIGIDYIGVQSLYDDLSSSYRIDNGQHLPIFSMFGKFDELLDYLNKEEIGIFFNQSLATFNQMTELQRKENLTFIQHLVNKLRITNLKKWRVNYTFDSGHLLNDTQTFEYLYEKLNEILPNVQTGVTLPIDYPNDDFASVQVKKVFLEKILPKCHFTSILSEPNQIYNDYENEITDVEKFQEYTYRKVVKIEKLLAEWQLSLPIVVLEWNTLTGKDQFIGGNFFRGAIIFQELLKITMHAESCGFWINAGLYEKYLRIQPMKYDGLELFHNYSGCRPVFFILQFFKRLEGNVLSLGSDYLLIEKGGHYQLVLWNTNYFLPNLSIEATFLESLSIAYHIDTQIIVPNYYQVKQFELNRESGALFFNYADFDSKVPLDFEAHHYLAQSTQPRMKVFDMDVSKRFELDTTISSNGILLFEITPIYH
ncbi:MAG: helix-turn-helix domain-containing protein [Vagococcus sp.]|uniref:helix-turn-helix domain-containing protein n=1 Tax=Vagococcus sp. TaxID=1933889 RepID=UPI002FC67D39